MVDVAKRLRIAGENWWAYDFNGDFEKAHIASAIEAIVGEPVEVTWIGSQHGRESGTFTRVRK